MARDISEILNNSNRLERSFNTAVKISEMLDDFNVNIVNVSKIISTDQALTAKLLKYCNSAQYGFSRKVTTVKDAISIIGFKVLKTIIFTIISKSTYNKPLNGYGYKEGDFWKNSITCAVYARHLAKLVNYEDPDQAYTAALLRDIGKIPLNEELIENNEKVLESINLYNITFCEAESRLFEFSHPEVGEILGKKWNFPKVVTDAIRYHHSLREAAENACEDLDLIRIIHLGDYLTAIMGQGVGIDGMMYHIEPGILEDLGFSEDSMYLDDIISDIINLNTEIYNLAS